MSRRFAPVLTALILISSCFSYAEAPTDGAKPTSVRVRLKKSQTQSSITGMNLFFRTDTQSVQLPLLSSVVLKPELRAGVIFWTLVEKASGRILQNLSGKRVRVKGEMVRIGIMPSPQNIEFVAERIGSRSVVKADVIATMDLDEYLVGVLPHEMSADWPIEALKAQAVASRTYAINRIQMREAQGKSFHLDNNVMDQVFNWRESSAASEAKLKNVRLAVEQTRGQVLEDLSGNAVAAYFHADCGGRTEEPSQVWGSPERKLGTAVDSSCPFSPTAKWSWIVYPADLVAQLKTKLKLVGGDEIKEIAIEKLTQSGRVARLAMVLATGERKSLSGNDLRAGLGFDKLKSTKFELSRGPEGQFVFEGRGHGHGAGLCQWGSKALATAGANYRKILTHYYPRVQLNASN